MRVASQAVHATTRLQQQTSKSSPQQRRTNNHFSGGNSTTEAGGRGKAASSSFYGASSTMSRGEQGSEGYLAEEDLAGMFTPRNQDDADDDTVSLFSTYASAFPQPLIKSPSQRSSSPRTYQYMSPSKTDLAAGGGRGPNKPTKKRNRSANGQLATLTRKSATRRQDSKKKGVSQRLVKRLVQTAIAFLAILLSIAVIILVVGVSLLNNLQSSLEQKWVDSQSASSTFTTSSIDELVSDARKTLTGVGAGLVAGGVFCVLAVAGVWVACYVVHQRRKRAKRAVEEHRSDATAAVQIEAGISAGNEHPQTKSATDEKETDKDRNIADLLLVQFFSSSSSFSQSDVSKLDSPSIMLDGSIRRLSTMSATTNRSMTVSGAFRPGDDDDNSSAVTPLTSSPRTGNELPSRQWSKVPLSNAPGQQHEMPIFSDEDDDPMGGLGVRPVRSIASGKLGGVLSDDDTESFGNQMTGLAFSESFVAAIPSPSPQSIAPRISDQNAQLKLVRGTVLTVSLTNLFPSTVASAFTSHAFSSSTPTWLNEEGRAVGLFVEKFEEELFVRNTTGGNLKGFSDPNMVKNPITSLSSGQISDIVSRFIFEVTTIVEKFGGIVDCTSPTEIVATFNYHARIVKHEDVACRCAMTIDGVLRSVLLDWIRVVVVVSTGNNMVGLLNTTVITGGNSNNGPASSPGAKTIEPSSPSTRRAQKSKSDRAFVSAAQQASTHHRLIAGESLDLCRKVTSLCVQQLHGRVIVTETVMLKSELAGIPIDVIEPHWETRFDVTSNAPVLFQNALTPQASAFNDTDSIHSKSGHFRGGGGGTSPASPSTGGISPQHPSSTAAPTKTVTLYELVPGGMKKRKATAEVQDLTAAFLLFRRLKFQEAKQKFSTYKFVNYQAYRLATLCEHLIEQIDRFSLPENMTRYSRREVHWEDPFNVVDCFNFWKFSLVNPNHAVATGLVGEASSSSPVVVDSGSLNTSLRPQQQAPLNDSNASSNFVRTYINGTSVVSAPGAVLSAESPLVMYEQAYQGSADNPLAGDATSMTRRGILSSTPVSLVPISARGGLNFVPRILTPNQWLSLVCAAAFARDALAGPIMTTTASTASGSASTGGAPNSNVPSNALPRNSIRNELFASFGSLQAALTEGGVVGAPPSPPSQLGIPSDHPVVLCRTSLHVASSVGTPNAATTTPQVHAPFATWGAPGAAMPITVLGGAGTTSANLTQPLRGGSVAGGSVSTNSAVFRSIPNAESDDTDDTDTNGGSMLGAERSGNFHHHNHNPPPAIIGDPQTQSASDAYLEAVMGIDDVSSPTKPALPHNNREMPGMVSPTMSWRAGGGLPNFTSRRQSVVSTTSDSNFRHTASNLKGGNNRNGNTLAGIGAVGGLASFNSNLNGSTSSRKSLKQGLDESNASIHITRRKIVEMQAANQKKNQKNLVEQVAEEDNALFSIFVGGGGGGNDSGPEDSDTSKRSSVVPAAGKNKHQQSSSVGDAPNTGSGYDDDDDTSVDESSSSEESIDVNGATYTRAKAFVGEGNDIPAVIRDVSGHRYHLSGRCLGKGAFGEVFLAMDAHGTLLATKIFRLAAAAGNAAQYAAAGGGNVTSGDVSDSLTPEERQKAAAELQIHANARATAYTLMNEVEVLAQLRHPNIASYVSCAVVGKEGQYFAMMMEFLSAGSLRNMMDVQHFGGPLPPCVYVGGTPPAQQPPQITVGSSGTTVQRGSSSTPRTSQGEPTAAVLSLAEALRDTDDSDSDGPTVVVAAPPPKGPRKRRGAGVGGSRVLPRPAVMSYIKDILKGIAFLHEQQYVHCDIKPENVLLTAEGTCKLADFGTAKLMEDYDISTPNKGDDVNLDGVPNDLENSSTTPAIRPRATTSGGVVNPAQQGRVWGGGVQATKNSNALQQQDSFASKNSDAFGSEAGVGGKFSSITSNIKNTTTGTIRSPNEGTITSANNDGYTLEEEEERQRVLGAMVRGTPRYMAPEAVLGTFTPAADIFSIGILVVELVTGEHPWAHVTGSDTTFMMRLARDSTMRPKVYRHLFYTPRKSKHPKKSNSSTKHSVFDNSGGIASSSKPLEDNMSDPLPWDASSLATPHFDVSCSSSPGDEEALKELDDDFFFDLMNNAGSDDDGDDEEDISNFDSDWNTGSVSDNTLGAGFTREVVRRRSLQPPPGVKAAAVAGGKRLPEARKSNASVAKSDRERSKKLRKKQRRRNGQRYVDDHIGKVLFHVVTRCLKRNPEQRPSVHQLLEWLGVE